MLGVTTNVAFLRALLADPDVRAGRLDTGLVERRQDATAGVGRRPVQDAAVAAVLGRLLVQSAATDDRPGDPFGRLVGWRLGGTAWDQHVLQVGDERVVVHVRGPATGATVRLPDGTDVPAHAQRRRRPAARHGRRRRHGAGAFAQRRARHLGRAGRVGVAGARAPGRPARRRRRHHVVGPLVSPLPGTVTAVHVEPGDAVVAGQPVVTVEAMKMEHVVRATAPGVVVGLDARVGQTVPLDAVLAHIGPADTAATDGATP